LAALLLAACDPFGNAGETVDRVVADGDINAVDLPMPDRQLPATARNIQVREWHWQGSSVRVRFDAPYDDARRFAEAVAGGPLRPGFDPWTESVGHWGGEDYPPWWPPSYPAGAAAGASRLASPFAKVLLLRHGPMATVWLDSGAI
jgi:hypothetical protein